MATNGEVELRLRSGGDGAELGDDFESALSGEHRVRLDCTGRTRVDKAGRANRIGGDIQIFAWTDELNHNLARRNREGNGDGAERASFFRSDGELAVHIAVGEILEAVGFFADLQLLSSADAEELKVGEGMSAEEGFIVA